MNSFTIRCQRGSAGRVLEDVGINANLNDGQHLARTCVLIWCTRNQFKSPVHSNIYLLIYRRFYRAYNSLSISTLHLIKKNDLSMHQQVIHSELWTRVGNLNTFVYNPVKIFQSVTQLVSLVFRKLSAYPQSHFVIEPRKIFQTLSN